MFLSLALATLTCAQPPAFPNDLSPFKHGDRIVWIGGTLVEREQRHGYWETALIRANLDKAITVRNLGWSGDTVYGEARGRFDFDKPDVCFKQSVNLTLELKPTFIFICYGTNESFEGKDGLPKFEKGMEKLLDALKPANARIVLFSPMQIQKSPSLLDPKLINEKLALYREAIKQIAEKRGLPFADLYMTSAALPPGATDNGMHLTAEGYKATAESVFLASLLSVPRRIDWVQTEPLRQAISVKNELFFHRWRPQNETYLFGFRKHEQGKNAREVAEFDPLVTKAEEEIERIRKSLQK